MGVEAEVGGSAGVSSGGLCNLICAIVFLIFFLGDLSTFIYYLCLANGEFIHVSGWSASTTRAVTCGVLGGAMALWLILSLCCCCCYKKAKGSAGPTTVTYVDSYEVGGGAGVELEVEVELECPDVEIEVELEAPEVEVEVEIEAPEIE